ncbi:hypothetical protein Sjap_020808 [Stephania japonica]|uniref:Uncharacterized protein n=1 Tax=Stephania japonica TaxID=461633 RepID=A0AAP0FAB5_9MAGN
MQEVERLTDIHCKKSKAKKIQSTDMVKRTSLCRETTRQGINKTDAKSLTDIFGKLLPSVYTMYNPTSNFENREI